MNVDTTDKTPLNVFISAGTHFLGRAVIRGFVAAGYRVTAMTHNRQGAESIRKDGGRPIYAESSRAGEIRSAMQLVKADVALHLAPQGINEVPFLGMKHDAVLVDDTAAFAQAAGDAGVRFLAYVGHAYLYGDTRGKTVDETAGLMRSAYPLFDAARSAEEILQSSPVPACVLRAGYVYGSESTALQQVAAALKGGRVSIPVGRGNNYANWIYVDDLVAALLLAAEKQPAGEIFNVVDDAPVVPGKFLTTLSDVLGIPEAGDPGYFYRLFPNKSAEQFLALSVKADNAKVKSQLNWDLKYPGTTEGLEQVALLWRAAMKR